MYQLEISEDKDLYNQYYFAPVIVSNSNSMRLNFEDVCEMDTLIAIRTVYVECFLLYFLKKYFDPELEYNKKRSSNWDREGVYQNVFDENNKQASNFFTYEAITNMISEMVEVADLLEQDYENQSLRSIIEKYDVHYLHDSDDEAWSTGEFGELKDHIYIVSDFYRRLSNKLSQMMEMNPNAFLINFEYGY